MPPLNLSGFPLDKELIYLNHAAVGVWHQATHDAVCAFANQCLHQGARHYPRWLTIESECRELAATLLNLSDSDDIAFVKNTSEGLSMIAEGLQWQAGDEVIIARQEFPSNRIPWQAQQRHGIKVIEVDLESPVKSPEQAYAEAITAQTRLLSVSSVQYANGLRMDLTKLSALCRKQQILLVVDAIQSLGALQFDQQQIQADAVIADAHKWLLGPEGIGLFYTSPALREQLQLREYGWHMLKQVGDYENSDWQIADSARRFECGSPNMLGIHALHASLSHLLTTGMPAIETTLLSHTRFLIDKLKNIPGIEIVSNTEDARLSGSIAFRAEAINSAQLHQALMQKNIICAERDQAIRWSPHYYTSKKTLERAVDGLHQCLATLR